VVEEVGLGGLGDPKDDDEDVVDICS
jgi:hypothetical protein